jgi:hypothetical protein
MIHRSNTVLRENLFRSNTDTETTMLRRIRWFLGRLVLVLLLTAFASASASATSGATAPTTSGATEEDPDDEISSSPRFVLVEEHHHVVSHLVRFAREGFLRSHANTTINTNTTFPGGPEKERNPNGAVLIHIDSHADMGLPPGLNHLPAKTLFSNLPPENTEESLELLEHTAINDFLLLLGYMGIVDHIIFVEPPWSFLINHAHHTTVDISIGVVPGEAAYASIRNSPSSIHFSSTTTDNTKTNTNNHLSEDAMSDLEAMMDDDFEPVKIVPHDELLNHCPRESDNCNLRTVKFTTLPYQGAAEAIQKLLEATENKDRDIVLDVDLDGFSTTSPGALSLLQTTIPDYRVLTRIFHTVHGSNICDMEKDYWERLKTSGGGGSSSCENKNLSFVHGPSFQPPSVNDDDVGSLLVDNKIVSDRSRALVEDLHFSYQMDEDAIQALAEVFEHYLPVIDASVYDDNKFNEMMNSFLLQPFFVPELETIGPILDFHFDHLFRTIFKSRHNHRVPKVVNVVRSPFYTPDHHLDVIECEVFDRLLDMFGNNGSKSTASSSILYHSDEVQVDRTKCLHETNKFPPPNRFSIGTNPHIEPDMWENTDRTFSWFYEDDDELFGRDYKFDPIVVDFVNEHKHPLLVKSTKDGQILRVLPGQRLTELEVDHLTKWELFKSAKEEPATATNPNSKQQQPKQPITAPFLTVFFNGKDGAKQSHGSKSGRIPVHHSTPVKMEVQNPSDSGIHVALKTAPYNESKGGGDPETGTETETASLLPGETKTLQTVHGKLWTIHDVSSGGEVDDGFEQQQQPPIIGKVIANATFGEKHSVLLFSDDETSSGNEL